MAFWAVDGDGRQVRRPLALGQVLGASEAVAYHRVVGQYRQLVRMRVVLVLACLVTVSAVPRSRGAWRLTCPPGSS